MPWKEMSAVNLRMRFVMDATAGLMSVSELAEHYEVSRKTAYKWMARYLEEGAEGLEDRPPRALVVANRTASELEELIVAARRRHRTWGPKKLLRVLEESDGDLELPARSTVAAILKRNGLSRARVRVRREGHPGRPMSEAQEPNAIWAMDFKGHFRTRDGRYCYPLTVTDQFSRYLICCDGHLSTCSEGVKASLERAFRSFGLPDAMRSDNGSPFASTGLGRLSRIGVWLLKLGIRRELIQPGRPDQNGRHERMHRTLKDEATRPPQANVRRQQMTFDSFTDEFNHERPHEALGFRRPAEIYQPSPRPFPDRLPEPTYPAHFEVRLVSRNGGVRWKGQWLNVGHSLVEEPIGFEPVGDGVWDAYFTSVRLGRFDEREMRLVGTMATHYRCGKRGDRPLPRRSLTDLGDLLSSHSTTPAK